MNYCNLLAYSLNSLFFSLINTNNLTRFKENDSPIKFSIKQGGIESIPKIPMVNERCLQLNGIRTPYARL